MSVNAMEFDYLYNVVDRLYSRLARRSGLSSCAYWMMYALVRAGGTESLRTLAASWAFSKQTINSALKALEARELIALEFEEGSRKNKRAVLTPAGHAFAAADIVPAMEAEGRAFGTLAECEREQLLGLIGRYTAALEAELDPMAAQDGEGETGNGGAA